MDLDLPAPGTTVYTIGHSTRTIEAFIRLLTMNGAGLVADVRTVPKSRHSPQFNKDVLPASLAARDIAYEHMPGLGGLRHPGRDSVNTGWRNASFRGYADYMQTEDFELNLRRLMHLAGRSRTVVMCAEAVPWRCHRSLIADALVVRRFAVHHIIGLSEVKPHVLTPWALTNRTVITYPPQGQEGTTLPDPAA
jgi:uncharacterized protein (DUF488 family)